MISLCHALKDENVKKSIKRQKKTEDEPRCDHSHLGTTPQLTSDFCSSSPNHLLDTVEVAVFLVHFLTLSFLPLSISWRSGYSLSNVFVCLLFYYVLLALVLLSVCHLSGNWEEGLVFLLNHTQPTMDRSDRQGRTRLV